MQVLISNSDGRPIYEQIVGQIKGQILTGALAAGEGLPSIRLLAKELRISVITTKRAYEELEREGFIETFPGKGSFVAAKNTEMLREEQLRVVEEHLAKAVDAAQNAGITLEEMDDALHVLYGNYKSEE